MRPRPADAVPTPAPSCPSAALDPVLDRRRDRARRDERRVEVGDRAREDRGARDLADRDLVGRRRVAEAERRVAAVLRQVAEREFDALLGQEARRGAVGRHRGDAARAMPADLREDPRAVGRPAERRRERGVAAVGKGRGHQAPVGAVEQVAPSAAALDRPDPQPEVPRRVEAIVAGPRGDREVLAVGAERHRVLGAVRRAFDRAAPCRSRRRSAGGRSCASRAPRTSRFAR